jgi:hypothetical protein
MRAIRGAWWAAGWLGALVLSGSGVARAQGVIPVRPGFMPDPMVLEGIAGGGAALGDMYGGCRGYAQGAPSHVFMVQAPMRYLAFLVNSSFDSTLMVQTPDGQVVCNDDSEGLLPRVELQTGPGAVRVWVGSYSSSGGGPYRLGVSELNTVRAANLGMPGSGALGFSPRSPVLSPTSSPLYGEGSVAPGNGVITTLAGQAGGALDASVAGGDCRGWITAEPTHVLRVLRPMGYLRMVVRADHDTTLTVMYPDGRIACNDDGAGNFNPMIEGPTGEGPLRVWVGSYARERTGPSILGAGDNPGLTPDMLAPGRAGMVVVPPPQVVVPPPQVVMPPPQVLVPPAQQATRVELLPRLPVTLFGAGTPVTLALWSPRGGPRVEVGVQRIGAALSVVATIGSVTAPVITVPEALVRDVLITVTQRPDQRLLVQAERADAPGQPGGRMMALVRWPGAGATVPEVAQQWVGAMTDRLPRWSR